MTNVFRCRSCGNVVTQILDGGGELTCCEEPMERVLLVEKPEGREKHKPVISQTPDGIEVKIGAILHPMTQEHYIVFVQVVDQGKVVAGRQFRPGDQPMAKFNIPYTEQLEARAFCNLHGMWKN